MIHQIRDFCTGNIPDIAVQMCAERDAQPGGAPPIRVERPDKIASVFIMALNLAEADLNALLNTAARASPTMQGCDFALKLIQWKRPLFLCNFGDDVGKDVGYSMQFGERTSASLSASQIPSRPRIMAEASRNEGTSLGGYGWQIMDAEGAQPYRAAGMSYRGEKGRAEASVQQYESNNTFTATAHA